MNRVGAVYGQGLYTLAKEEHLEDDILQELCLLNGAFEEQPAFLKLLASANLSKQDRLGIIEESFRGKVQQYVLNFLMLLTEKGYVAQFTSCYKAYRQQYNEDKGILQVRAVSATPLTEDQIRLLTDKLTTITGKTIDLTCKEDPAVLGGIRLSYGGIEVDGTVQSRLQAMEKRLKNTVL